MSEFFRFSGVTAFVMALIACIAPSRNVAAAAQTATAAHAPVHADPATLEDFTRRLNEYVALQGRLAKESPKLKETKNPGDISAAQDALAARIQAVRHDARRGDIFTPQVAAMLRRLMYPELDGQDGRNTKGNIDDEQASMQLRVNARYPASEPLQTLPPNILARLPRLPADLEYRVVGNHLVLRDADANIIIDFIPNAIRS